MATLQQATLPAFKEVELPFNKEALEEFSYSPELFEFDSNPEAIKFEPVDFSDFEPISTKIDWLEVKMLYLTDRTLTYQDLADKLGVSLKTVKKHGSRDGFARGVQEVSNKVESHIKDNMVDEQVAANERHIEMFQESQELAIRYLAILDAQVDAAERKAEAEGRVVTFDELPSTRALLSLTKTLVAAVNAERVCLSLPIKIAPAPVGWKPPVAEDPALEGMTIWQRLDYYAAQNKAEAQG